MVRQARRPTDQGIRATADGVACTRTRLVFSRLPWPLLACRRMGVRPGWGMLRLHPLTWLLRVTHRVKAERSRKAPAIRTGLQSEPITSPGVIVSEMWRGVPSLLCQILGHPIGSGRDDSDLAALTAKLGAGFAAWVVGIGKIRLSLRHAFRLVLEGITH